MNGINFTLGAETETYFACSAILKGEALIFGGMREYNQVSLTLFLLLIKFGLS